MSLRRVLPTTMMLVLLLTSVPFVSSQGDGISVSFTNLREDEIVGGTVLIKGDSTNATHVELKFDAEDTWRLAQGTDQWNYTWDTTPFSEGAHTIFVRARNTTTTSDTVSVRVHVDNTLPEYIAMDISATPLDTGPGEDISISGFIEYDNGVKVKDASVTMEVVGEGISAQATTDDNGYFIETIKGPSDAGHYIIKVRASDGTLNATREFELDVTTPYQPDLTVEKIELNPAEPRTDETVEIYATIKNLGDQGAGAKVKFYDNDNLLDSKNVNIEKTKLVKTVWIARPGNHTLKVELTDVDPVDKDLDNNELSIKVVPRAEPDVVIIDVVLSNPTPKQGQHVSISVKLENKGDAGTTGNVKIYDGSPANEVLLTQGSFTINANETLHVFLTWSPQKGDHTLYAVIDVVGQDTNPDHTQTESVTVLPPDKKNDDSPGFGIMILMATVVVALYLTRKR